MTLPSVSHEESLELAGLYVLDAVTPDERAAVDAHLRECDQEHPDFEELGAVVPALASLADPVTPPAALKSAVMAAYRAEVGASSGTQVKPWDMDVRASARAAAPAPRRQAPNWMGWIAAAVAVGLLAVLGAVGLNLKSQADLANQRADQMSQAVAAMTAPGSQVAVLHGSGAAAGINGFMAVPSGGSGYMVMTDVPPAPAGKTYQAWYIVNGEPASAGTMSAGSDGNVVAAGLQPLPGTSVVAVTVEPAGGSAQPTSEPIIVGTMTTVS
jgi:anti-sigma-K factor RskA